MLGYGLSGMCLSLLFLNICADSGTVARTQGDSVSDPLEVSALCTP